MKSINLIKTFYHNGSFLSDSSQKNGIRRLTPKQNTNSIKIIYKIGTLNDNNGTNTMIGIIQRRDIFNLALFSINCSF